MNFPRSIFSLMALLFSLQEAGAASYRYDHVVVVIEENTDYGQVIGSSDAPFINQLAAGGVNFTEVYGMTHPSQPNYIHLFSGENQGILDNNPPLGYPFSTPNLGAALLAAGRTFKGYSEDLPAIGDRDTTGTDVVIGGTSYSLYRRKHNPWANWQAAAGTDPIPANQLPFDVNLRFSDFPADFNQLPDVAIVVPNQQNDMHDGTIRMGDDWLREKLGGYAEWALTHNSLLIITFDEDNLTGPNKIPTVFYGAGLMPGTVNDTRWTLHNILRTMEDMYGTTHAGRAAKLRPITGIFPGDPPVLSKRFRQGLNGYTAVTDTMVRFISPTTDASAVAAFTADLDNDVAAGNQPSQILLHFGNLFGSATTQIPLNATIISAKLSVWTGAGVNDDSNDQASAHRMLVPWGATDTWNSLANGISTDDVEAVAENSFTHMPELENAPVILDVTNDIAAFLSGTSNYGWVLTCTGPDSWGAVSSEGTTTTQRPTLQIAYTLPVASGYAAWQLGKFGGTPAGSQAADDPDTDGTPNLLEYALNGNPVRAGAGAQVSISNVGNQNKINFTRNLDATDITLTIEASDSLADGSWSSVATCTTGTWTTEPNTSVRDVGGSVGVSLPPATRKFVRVTATLAGP
jgi:hypothetical protein